MSEFEENIINDEELQEVSGGTAQAAVKVKPITPIWVRVTSTVYEKGHRLKVDGITADGAWYRLLIYDPRGGTCYAFIAKRYTERI